MKRIFTFILFASVLFINAASAQNRNGWNVKQDRNQVNQSKDYRNYNDQYQFKDDGYNKDKDRYQADQSKDYGYNKDKGRNDDYNRQADYDRMNKDYDRKIEVYRNDRSLNRYERNRRIQELEYERQQGAKAFGTGLVVGGIAAILLGVLISGGH